jgi:hypothetical protein
MKRDGLTESPAGKWTRPEDYLGAMARKRRFRRDRAREERSQPELPRLLLSTLPFLVVIALLAVLAVAIMVAAFPLAQPHEKAAQIPPREQGVAARGWFQEAQREFHH